MSATIDLSDRPAARRIWLALAGWTAAVAIWALVLGAQIGLRFADALWGAAINLYVMGALVWIVCLVNVRLQLWKQRPVRTFSAHVVLGLVAVDIWAAVQVGAMRAAVGRDYWTRVYAGTWLFQLLSAGLTYAAGLGFGLTVQGFDRDRQRQQREARLEIAAREVEIAAIKAQLQPHFLLNSLNSILALIGHDPAEARGMVMRLASLLHSVFDRLDEPLVSLDQELDMVRDYLEIEGIRFKDRLRFTIDAEDDARHVQVPPFLLQPLVENAVKHGIEPYGQPGDVRVTARLHGARLCISVTDTGRGFDGASPPAGGHGLDLTRRRLQTVYGNEAASIRANHHEGRFSIDLELPLSLDAG